MLKKLRLTAEAGGEVAPAGGSNSTPPPAPAAPAAPAPVPEVPLTPTEVFAKMGSWQALVPDDFQVDYQGKTVPGKEHPFIKEPKTFGDFLKSAYDAHKELGARVRIPGKDAKPEEKAAFVQKVTEAGLMPAPRIIPEAPDKYDIKPPEGFGDIDQDTIGKVRQIAHEEQIPQAALDKLMGVYFDHHKDIMPVLGELKELVPTLKLVKEDAIKSFEDEMRGNGHDPEQAKAVVGRFIAKKYSQDQVLTLGDYGNSPIVMRMLYDLALASREDFGPIKLDAPPAIHDEAAQAELTKMLTPGTTENAIWVARTPEGERMREKAMELRRRITGGR